VKCKRNVRDVQSLEIWCTMWSYKVLTHFWATVSKTVPPYAVGPLSGLSCLSVTFMHCGQTVGRIKMKLGMQVGLGPGHIVLDGDSASPSPKGHSPHPIFGPYLLRPNGCMDQGATRYGDRPQPRRLCVRWWPSSQPPPTFRPMFIIVIVILLEHCTMHSRYWFVQVQVQVLVFYVFYS